MTHTTAISIVMSVHNDADRVCRAVQSIAMQTFGDWELIIIDDGSSDGTSKVLDWCAAKEPRIRVIHQKNTGLTRALILGCEQSRGKYIARQDSDDWSHPERLAEQFKLLEQDERIGFASCSTQYVGPEDESLNLVVRPTDPQLATLQLLQERQGPPAHGSVMFRRKLYDQVGGYRPEFYFAQDSDLWLRMAEHSLIGYVANVLYTHRRDLGSISGSRRLQQKELGRLGQACRAARRDDLPEQPFLDEASALTEEILANRRAGRKQVGDETEMAYLLGSQLAQNGDARARKYLFSVLGKQPWHLRAWVRLMQAMVLSGANNADLK